MTDPARASKAEFCRTLSSTC